MGQELYGMEVSRVICEQTGFIDALDVREDGVYVKNEYLHADLAGQAFMWIPACEMDWPGAPDPLTAPALPIPFTARDLAAFMLDGAGQGIQSMFGRIEHGPDEVELASLDMRATKVRKALREAYSLAQRAQCVAGADNHDEQQRAADLISAYDVSHSEAMRREKVMERVIAGARNDGVQEYGDVITRDEYLLRLARVNEPLAPQKAEALKAKAEADTRHLEWLKAMVYQLLNPAFSEASCAAPVSMVAVECASDAKPWLSLDPKDPAPEQPWYTPARYFARQLVIADSTMLTKRMLLADKVSKSLAGAGIFKRGGVKPHSADTVLKAFANVALG